MKRALGVLALVALASMLGHTGLAGAQGAKKLNPFTGNPEAIKEGRSLYMQRGCSGCHGAGGGGGMALPIIDDSWKFGSSDEVLFKLIKGEIEASTMPKVFGDMEPDQIWKMIAYIRSLYAGDPSKVDW
jgi:mono/diheme cytochrome c family protein